MARIHELLREQALRFCEYRERDVEVARLLREGAVDVDALRAMVARGDECAFFAAVGLASVGDATGLPLLRHPNGAYVTNSGVEVGLALCARLALGDGEAPLHFINASMLGELAELVGAFPPDRSKR